MRTEKLFSTMAMAVVTAIFATSILQAQQSRFQPPANGELPPPTVDAKQYLPSTTAAQNRPIQQVGYWQDDVKVPAILGGKKELPAKSTAEKPKAKAQQTAPIPTVTNDDQPTLSATAHAARQSTVAAPETQSFSSTQVDRSSWTTEPLRQDEQVIQAPTDATPTPALRQTDTSTFGSSFIDANIATSAPNIRVEGIGPNKISIHKKSTYEIHVTNQGDRPAENLIVGIDFPEFVEIIDSQPTNGNKEITDGTSEARMIWNLPFVEARSVEKIIIEVTPTEARPFDVDVEWTFLPIQGKTRVEVTEPKLALQISGPTEVQFGEKALYHVTVINPGTGTAENVSVMLPEALGGERASLGNIEPAQQKQFQVELIARSAGMLELTTSVTADGNLAESVARSIMVRRAVLDAQLIGPKMKYAGSTAKYRLTVTNTGDAMAKDIVAAIALPKGVEYVSGIDSVEKIDGGIRWNVGMLSPGNERAYEIICTVNLAGDIRIEAATRGAGDLAAIDSIVTKVEAIADLVLSVQDPKGPLPTGEKIDYQIKIKNRGTKAARNVKIVMQFAEGIEPVDAKGLTHELMSGQVVFTPISQIDPNQEITLLVTANANRPGSHRFRAQLVCEESDSHEVSEGTTRFFGDAEPTPLSSNEDAGQFKR